MHNTLRQIIDRAKVAEAKAGDNGVHGDLVVIAQLAREAQQKLPEYIGVLIREQLEVAKSDRTVRDGLKKALSQVHFTVLVEGGEPAPTDLGSPFVCGGLIYEVKLDFGEEVSPQLTLPLC